MKSLKIIFSLIITSIILFACSRNGFKTISDGVSGQNIPNPTPSPTPNPGPSPSPSPSPGTNVMSVTVLGNTPAGSAINIPVVSVKICVPGSPTQCQTISNVLLDTGSYGLRLFSSLVTLPLTVEKNSSGATYAECVSYAGGTSDWGSIAKADIIMGSETASSVPIQLINSSFGKIPSNCQNPDTSPQEAGFNGIIGVGLFTADCQGPDQNGNLVNACTADANNGIYYACSSSSCSSTTIPEAAQVANPVAFLPASNNGVILELPALTASGANNVTGTLVLGIDTQADNTPSNFTVFPANNYANFHTLFNGTTYDGFIDSGSNGIFFPGDNVTGLTPCQQAQGFYCPSSTVSLSATQKGANGTPSESIPFQVINIEQTSNSAYNNIAGSSGSGTNAFFDWGLPFFFGHNICVGIAGKSATAMGTGPYWAY